MLSAPDKVSYFLKKDGDVFRWTYFNRLNLMKTLNINITRNFDYNIYQLRDGKIIPSYHFDFGDNTISSEYSNPNVLADMQKQLEVNKDRFIYTIGAVHESEKYLMFLTNLEGFFVLDKTEREVNSYRGISSYEHMTSLNERNLIPLNNSENKVCFDLLKSNASLRERYLTDMEYKDTIDEKYAGTTSWEIFNLDDDSLNPVLLFYTFK